MELIHERLKSELAALGIKATAAARAAGMPDSQGLRDTLNGRKRLTADLLALLIPLGVDAQFVLTGERDESAPVLSAEEQTMLEYFRAASPAIRRAAMGALLGAPAITQITGGSHHSTGSSAVHIGEIKTSKGRK